MKQTAQFMQKFLLSAVAVLGLQTVFAQKDVEVNGHDVGSWFSSHWMWIAGAIVLLLILLFASGGGSRRKSTTIVKDANGNVKSVTTKEDLK